MRARNDTLHNGVSAQTHRVHPKNSVMIDRSYDGVKHK